MPPRYTAFRLTAVMFQSSSAMTRVSLMSPALTPRRRVSRRTSGRPHESSAAMYSRP
jgi:hypothetical protein